jgi:DNA-binding transcriptional LysR family regulator
MDPITLDQLNVFLQVAATGSFSSAARSMHRAQSAVSYSVANFERLLGVKLFDRTTHTPTLSEAGESLLGDARSIQYRVDELLARARGMAQGVEPRLKIAVSVMFPMGELVEALGAFRTQFPAVSLVLHTEILGGVSQMVLDGAATLGISEPLPKPARGLQQWPLTTVEMVHVVSASHPLAKMRRTKGARAVPSAILEEHVQLVVSDRSRLTQGTDHGVLGGRTWRLADLGTKLAFLRAGFGWGGMPLHMVESDLAAGTLVRIRPAEIGELRLPLLTVFRGQEPPGPAGRWLIERLHARASTPATKASKTTASTTKARPPKKRATARGAPARAQARSETAP